MFCPRRAFRKPPRFPRYASVGGSLSSPSQRPAGLTSVRRSMTSCLKSAKESTSVVFCRKTWESRPASLPPFVEPPARNAPPRTWAALARLNLLEGPMTKPSSKAPKSKPSDSSVKLVSGGPQVGADSPWMKNVVRPAATTVLQGQHKSRLGI
jgi:hypothetical protein